MINKLLCWMWGHTYKEYVGTVFVTTAFDVKSLKIHVPPETLMQITKNNHHYNLTIDLVRANADVVLKKIQPRRIVLEEISKEEYHRLFNDERCSDIYNMRGSYWRVVKETDIPLTNEEPYLKLSVNDCKSLLSTNDNYAAYHKVQEFVKDKQ